MFSHCQASWSSTCMHACMHANTERADVSTKTTRVSPHRPTTLCRSLVAHRHHLQQPTKQQRSCTGPAGRLGSST